MPIQKMITNSDATGDNLVADVVTVKAANMDDVKEAGKGRVDKIQDSEEFKKLGDDEKKKMLADIEKQQTNEYPTCDAVLTQIKEDERFIRAKKKNKKFAEKILEDLQREVKACEEEELRRKTEEIERLAREKENQQNQMMSQMMAFQAKKAKFNPATGKLYIAMEWPIEMIVDKQWIRCGFIEVGVDGKHRCVKENFQFANWGGCGQQTEVNFFDFDGLGNVYFLGEEYSEFQQNGPPAKTLFKMTKDGVISPLSNENQQIDEFYATRSGAIFFRGNNTDGNGGGCGGEGSFLRIFKPDGGIKRVSMPSGSYVQFFHVDIYDSLVYSAQTGNGNTMKKVSFDADFEVTSTVDLTGEANFGWPKEVKFDAKGRIYMVVQNWNNTSGTNLDSLYMIQVKYNPINGEFFSEMTALTDDTEFVKRFGIIEDTIYYTGEDSATSDPFFKKRVIGEAVSENVTTDDLEVYNFYVDATGTLFFSATDFNDGSYFVAYLQSDTDGKAQIERINDKKIGKIADFELVQKQVINNSEVAAPTKALPASYLMIAEPPSDNNCCGPKNFKIKLVDLTKTTENVYTMVTGLKFEPNNGGGAKKFSLIQHTESQVYISERYCDNTGCHDEISLVDIITGNKYSVAKKNDNDGGGPLQVLGKYAEGKILVRKSDTLALFTVGVPTAGTTATVAEDTSTLALMGTGYKQFFPNWWDAIKTNALIDNKIIFSVQSPNIEQPTTYYKNGRVMVYNINANATVSNRRRYTAMFDPLRPGLAQCQAQNGDNYFVRYTKSTDTKEWCQLSDYNVTDKTCKGRGKK